MLVQHNSAQDFLKQVQDLPCLPDVVMKVYQLADNPTVTAQSLSQLIGKDQAFAARLLRMANSAYYGLSRQVSSIDDAVVVLGAQTLKHLALLAATYPILNTTLNGYTREPDALWRHSLATAMTAQMMGRMLDIPCRNEVFTAGLLHDLGKLVLKTHYPNKMDELSRLIIQGSLVPEAETRLFGLTHEEIGAALAERWNLPVELTQAIRYHHNPAKGNSSLCALIHVADFGASSVGYALNSEIPIRECEGVACDLLKINPKQLDTMIEKASIHLEESQTAFEFN